MVAIPRRIKVGNKVLAPFNLELREVRPTAWDRSFQRWIREAAEQDRDPNDLGDRDWSDDRLDDGIADHYLPLVSPTSRVLELGPGSGRLTRHLIGSCAHLTLVDASPAVCKWLTDYLAAKGEFSVVHMDGVSIPSVPSNSIDVALAHGVVEHLDQEVLAMLLSEIGRILVPGGQFAFSFDDLCSPVASTILSDLAGRTPAHRFRLYHPSAIERLAEMFGFDAMTFSSRERIAFGQLTRRAQG